jgi:uncharacterized membrane protein
MSGKIRYYFARSISTAFLPPIVLFAAILSNLLHEQNVTGDAIPVFNIALLFGVFIPIGVFIFLLKRNRISEQDAREKSERTIPYIVGIVLMLIGQYLLYTVHARPHINLIWLSFLLNSIFILIINRFWKISAHLLSVACAFANMCFYGGVSVYIFTAVIVVVAWARYELECHTDAQLFWGTLLGTTVPLVLRVLVRS